MFGFCFAEVCFSCFGCGFYVGDRVFVWFLRLNVCCLFLSFLLSCVLDVWALVVFWESVLGAEVLSAVWACEG